MCVATLSHLVYNWRTDFQKYRFTRLYVNKHFCSSQFLKMLPLDNALLFIKRICIHSSIFGVWSCKTEDVTNTTFTQSQILCNSWHLFLIVVCIKASHHHIVAVHLSLAALFTANHMERCVFVCESQGSCHILSPHLLF